MRKRHFSDAKCRRWLPGALLTLTLVCRAASSPLDQGQELQREGPPASPPVQEITIPDGTPIHLRFAQSVRGPAVVPERYAVKKGDQIRLVVAADVRVGSKIVFAKGALAEASVIRAWRRNTFAKSNNYDTVFTGLSLKLDWVSAVTGAQAPLRPARKGHARAFDVEALSSKGGIEVTPHNATHRMIGALVGADLFTTRAFHEKLWVPAGAHMVAFLDGNLTLATADIDRAQGDLPAPNLTATLYVVRTKDGNGPSPLVYCDPIEIGSLAPRQCAVADLAPGKYSCHADTSPAVELVLEGGNEYYLRLQQSTMSGKWELRLLGAEEGEDRIAGTEMLPPRSAAGNSNQPPH
jgi:hypothetical protein